MQRIKIRKRKLTILTHYSNPLACACCGETNIEFLSIDHIHGGGHKHTTALKKRGTSFYVWLQKNDFPPGYRVLCINCNFSLGQYGYCPHTEKREWVPKKPNWNGGE